MLQHYVLFLFRAALVWDATGIVCLFVFHHKKITKKFKMVEVLMRPRCAIAMLLVEAPA